MNASLRPAGKSAGRTASCSTPQRSLTRSDAPVRVAQGGTQLTPQEFVLAALGVARAKDCLFVWSVQAPRRAAGGDLDAVITAVRDRAETGLTDDQADLVSYAGQVTGGNRVDQALFDRLEAAHGARWLVELTAVAGHFGLISGINNAFEVPPSPSGDSLPI